MPDKAAAIAAAIACDLYQPGRVGYRNPPLASVPRSRSRRGRRARRLSAAEHHDGADRPVEPETWSDRTIFAIVIGAAAMGLMMWSAIGYAVLETFVHWT